MVESLESLSFHLHTNILHPASSCRLLAFCALSDILDIYCSSAVLSLRASIFRIPSSSKLLGNRGNGRGASTCCTQSWALCFTVSRKSWFLPGVNISSSFASYSHLKSDITFLTFSSCYFCMQIKRFSNYSNYSVSYVFLPITGLIVSLE